VATTTACARTSQRTGVGRAAAETRRRIGQEIKRLRLDAGLSIRALAAAAGIDHAHLAYIELGRREPSFAVLQAIGEALGADLSIRLHPTSGPRVHDRLQAGMLEALFALLHPSWKKLPEVPVRSPARGYIDAVLAHPPAGTIVATECQSQIRRLEQQLRWAGDKADSLPSSPSWSLFAPADEEPPHVSRLLLLRSTAATREVARAYHLTLAATYPARAADAYAALTTGSPWTGPAILWARVENGHAQILDRPPRGVSVGR
jgi:transcriptional regulator with XRE-family HTH domain